MSRKSGPAHVVVDGSNIATEGRSLPSLTQLSEAVASFMEEHPTTAITVVVDATFGHRIDKKEVKEFEEGISNNELVAPPAGAVGRGDAFVLGIADKANATVLSNDSFQEFHGEYEWLFDEGRLIGGKPVPHVGWVWVDRIPVRGPISRKATRGSGSPKRSSGGGRSRSTADGRRSSAAASQPMPVPSAPPPRAKSSAKNSEAAEKTGRSAPQSRGVATAQEAVNELLPFLEFVEHHPVGTSVNGTVDAYSSHGAYITIGDAGVRGYVPLRLMADPPPRSARKVMKLGESVTVVVASFAPARRSIDCALPDMAKTLSATVDEVAPKKRTARRKPAAKATPIPAVDDEQAEQPALARRRAARKTTAKTTPAAKKTAAKKVPAKKTAAQKTAAKKVPSKRVPAKKTAAKKVPSKKVPAKKVPAKKTAAQKTAARKTAANKAPAKKTAARKAPATKTASTTTAATTTAAKSPAKRAATKRRAAAEPEA